MNRKRFKLLALALLGVVAASHSRADILEDFNFGDADGTLLAAAANSATPSHLWVEDDVDMSGASVAGGYYHIVKDNDGFGTNFLDIDNISAGRVWLVAEIAGWSFSSVEGPGDFDVAEPEEIRFDLLDNDGTSGSTITAEMEIERTDTGGLVLQGDALGAGTAIAPTDLPLSQADPLTLVLQLDKNANTYEIFSSTGGGFSSLGSGDVDPDRGANSFRFVVNNNFSGAGEYFDIDRLYLTTTNPIPEPTALAALAIGGILAAASRRRVA